MHAKQACMQINDVAIMVEQAERDVAREFEVDELDQEVQVHDDSVAQVDHGMNQRYRCCSSNAICRSAMGTQKVYSQH